MAVLQVIPFLLATTVPSNETSNRFVFTFNVWIQLKFREQLDKLDEPDDNALFITMICEPHILFHHLNCFIDKVNHFYVTDIYDDNFTVPAVIYERVQFIMTFDMGKMECYIDMQNGADKSFLQDICETIGDQLNIGTDIATPKGHYFTVMESSIVGRCLTFYQVYYRPGYNVSHYCLDRTFHTLGNKYFELEPFQTLHVSKYRYLDKCSPLRDYTIGKVFWPSIIPENFTSRNNESRSRMSFTTHSFTSTTEKTFEVRNEDKKIAGVVRETIILKLASLEGETL